MKMKEETAIKQAKKQTSPAKSGIFVNPLSKALKKGMFFGAKSYN